MNAKKILTWSLLFFVGISLAAVISRSRREPVELKPVVGAGADDTVTTPASPAPAAPIAPAKKNKQRVVVYYFHGRARCYTCKTIEKLTRESIDRDFAKEKRAGQVEFKAVNVEMRENSHFIQDYRLTSKSVVLQKIAGEKHVDWKILDKTWVLVRDKEAFTRYIQTEVKTMLGT